MMLRRLAKDESGMAMALAVMMIVIVGVMGAGLITFVNTDLSSVIESNQGQKAFNLADAGAQAAKSHLLMTDADFRNYDGTTDLAADPPNPESPWSCGVWNNTNRTCTSPGRQLTNLDSESDADATVWIQYLKPSLSSDQLDDPDRAPELVPSGETNYPVGKDFFKIISEGREGNARRKVEAIYNTYDLGVPKAYYTQGSITLNGNAGSITNISLFAGGNIDGQGGNAVAGEDLAYGDWCKSPYNTAARQGNPAATPPIPANAAGVGALGSVTNQKSGRDFDGPDAESDGAEFVANISGAPSACGPVSGRSQITFPFSAGLPDIEALRTAAQNQSSGVGNNDNYYELTANANVVSSNPGATNVLWPANSTSSTVVFVKFDGIGDRLSWNVAGSCNDDPVRGTLVIENGTFTTQPNQRPLRGAIVINSGAPGTQVYSDTGNTCMESFVMAKGDITIGGNVSPATQERGNSPGSYGLNLWSWRELYQ